jgi:hypothetical protein
MSTKSTDTQESYVLKPYIAQCLWPSLIEAEHLVSQDARFSGTNLYQSPTLKPLPKKWKRAHCAPDA